MNRNSINTGNAVDSGEITFSDRCFLSEMFSSIQGEGIYCGVRQLFIRLARCNLLCSYCDTKYARQIPDFFRVEETSGSGIFSKYPNPLQINHLLKFIRNFSKYNHHSISLTGGEPLLQTDFLKLFLMEMNTKNIKIYLDTNGTLPEALEEIIEMIDIVAMDMKLPSTSKTRSYWAEHRKFLEIANRKEVFVKIIVDDNTEPGEVMEVCGIISDVSKEIPLCIQPVAHDDGNIKIDMVKLIKIQDYTGKYLNNVRVIPQVHKYLNIL